MILVSGREICCGGHLRGQGQREGRGGDPTRPERRDASERPEARVCTPDTETARARGTAGSSVARSCSIRELTEKRACRSDQSSVESSSLNCGAHHYPCKILTTTLPQFSMREDSPFLQQASPVEGGDTSDLMDLSIACTFFVAYAKSRTRPRLKVRRVLPNQYSLICMWISCGLLSIN
jgi:hypothetical protein